MSRWFLGFAALGFAASSASTWVHRRLLTDPAFAPAADPELQRAIGWILGATQLRADIAWVEAAGLWRRLKRSRRFWR